MSPIRLINARAETVSSKPSFRAAFKDPMTSAAAIDRLVHHSVIIELNVPSYRAEAAKKARQGRGGTSPETPGPAGGPDGAGG